MFYNKKIFLALVMLGSSVAMYAEHCGTERETFVVGADFAGIGFPPFESLTKDDPQQIAGFDVAVACEVAVRLDFKDVQFKQIRFPGLIEALKAGEITSIISDMSITADRQEDAGFVKYNNDTLGMVFNATVFERFRDPNTVLSEINAFGESIGIPILVGVTVGFRQIDILNNDSVYPFIEPVEFEDLQAALDVLTDEGPPIAGIFGDGPTAVFLADNDEELFGLNNVVDESNTAVSQGLGIGINFECCQLYADIAQAIKDMTEDGTLARLRNEFNVGSFAPEDLTPEQCSGFESNINSNAIANFIFSKYCPCSLSFVIEKSS